jgi:hypothetical protein
MRRITFYARIRILQVNDRMIGVNLVNIIEDFGGTQNVVPIHLDRFAEVYVSMSATFRSGVYFDV